MKEQEFKDLQDVTIKPGWKVHNSLFDKELDKLYRQLKTVKPEELLKLQGEIRGWERAKNIDQVEIDNYTPETEDQQPD